jgi:hypothetical protein
MKPAELEEIKVEQTIAIVQISRLHSRKHVEE